MNNTINYDRHNPSFHHTLFNSYEYIIKPIKSLAKYIPPTITGDHLTLLSFLWSGMVLMAGYLARNNRSWLLLIPLVIGCHIVTDTLDGEVGRYRGLPGTKWGYFMDHFLDFTFTSAIFVAFLLYLPSRYHLSFFIIYLLSISPLITSFLSVDKDGLDITACVNLGDRHLCMSCTEGLFLLALLTIYLYATKGKPHHLMIWILVTLGIVIGVGNVYRKQEIIRTMDGKSV